MDLRDPPSQRVPFPRPSFREAIEIGTETAQPRTWRFPRSAIGQAPSVTQERAASHESPGVLQQRVGGAAGGGAAVDVASASASSLVTTRPGKFLVALRVSGGSDSERTSGARHPGLVLQCLALQHKSPPGLGPSPEAEQSASGGSGSVSGSADARGAASLIPPAPLPAGNVPAGRRGPPGDAGHTSRCVPRPPIFTL